MVAEVRGIRELSRKLEQLGPAVAGKALRSAVFAAALPVLKDAQARAPVNDRDYLRKTYKGRPVAPGFLKRNIRRSTWVSVTGLKARAVIGPRKEAFYGTQFVELGTSKMPRKPWLRPALASNRHVSLRVLGDALKKRIEAVARK